MYLKLKDYFKRIDGIQWLAWIFGIGIILSAFYYNSIMLGLALNLVVSYCVLINKKIRLQLSLGSKWVYIPLLIVCVSIIVSAIYRYFTDSNLVLMLSTIFIGGYYFVVYLVSRILGKEIYRPFAVVVVVETIGTILINLFIHYGYPLGGLVVNYNVATAILVLGSLLFAFKGQWIIASVAVVGLFFNGAEEGLLVIGLMFIVMLVRRDFDRRILIPIMAVIILAVIGLSPFGYTRMLYAAPIDKMTVLLTNQHDKVANEWLTKQHGDLVSEDNFTSQTDYVLHSRVKFLNDGLHSLKPMGSGYVLIPVDNRDHPIYNVPLVILQQAGLLAMLAWIIVMGYCLFKTQWKYVILCVLILGIVDNFMFCQLGIWTFAIIGVCSSVKINSDLIYKRNIA